MPTLESDLHNELIAALVLKFGRLVEDAAPGLAREWPSHPGMQQQRLTELSELAAALGALAAAASTLHRLQSTKSG
ncbi:hypothetical protein [Erythrobacter sp. EC-HK427]|uniref:hypothetical protein n=1 Tax=Erythrobacter sp. EC-HK427 TaxID=2038396 RepID=UPI001254E50A|nr:hypothetical protein [Erythrobacter sp. EC-HK427]VVT10273.1 hypothetical protein ERY430_50101 [Erythrobacter sp. EC-HK427]